MDRDLRPAAALQLRGTAGVVAVAVREQDQGEVLGCHLVPLERGEDGAQVAGRAGVHQHGLLAEQQVTVGDRAFDSNQHRMGRTKII